MPTAAEKQKVLDNRAEVISYTKDPSVFYLRIYRKEKRGYDSEVIPGVSDLQTACDNALEVYLRLATAPKDVLPKPVPVVNQVLPGVPQGRSGKTMQQRITVWVDKYLKEQKERMDAGLIGADSYRNTRVALTQHFQAYCSEERILYLNQIEIGCFDRMDIFFSDNTAQTRRKWMTEFKTFIRYLSRHKVIDPWTAQDRQLIPKVRLTDLDFTANPPFRDEAEYLTIMKWCRRYVKNQDYNPKKPRLYNRANLYFRRKVWTLLLLLRNSGLRPGCEALQLTWKNCEFQDIGRISQHQKDLDLGELQLQGIDESELTQEERDSLGRVERYIVHLQILDSKKGAHREVTCNAADALIRWRKWQIERAKEQGCVVTPDTKVFDTPRNGRWFSNQYNNYTKAWHDILRLAEDELRGPLLSKKPYCLYSFRSYRAMEFLEQGVDIALAARQLGHSPSIMMKVYAKLPIRQRAIKEAAFIEFGKKKDTSRFVDVDDI